MNKKKIYKCMAQILSIMVMSTSIACFPTKDVSAKSSSENKSETNLDTNDGLWTAEKVGPVSTPEAEVMVRVGDIDNFGLKWDEGYDPFSGTLTKKPHPFPGKPNSDGTDGIMVISGFDPKKVKDLEVQQYIDGYTAACLKKCERYVLRDRWILGKYWHREKYWDVNEENKVRPIELNFRHDNGQPKKINNAVLQMYVDDFQPGKANGIRCGNVKYKAQVCFDQNSNANDGAGGQWMELEGLSDILNKLDQSGPRGNLVTYVLPDKYMEYFQKYKYMRIKIDDENPRDKYGEPKTGDGYAIDFVKLMLNCYNLNSRTVAGTVKDDKGHPIKGAVIRCNNNEKIFAVSKGDGTYELKNVPMGRGRFTAEKSGYAIDEKKFDVAKTDDNKKLDFTLYPSQKPLAPIISYTPDTPTNQDVEVTIEYPDNPEVKKYAISLKEDGTPDWKIYKNPFKVSENCMTYAQSKSLNNDKGIESDISRVSIVNIDKSNPNAPKIITRNNDERNGMHVDVEYPDKAEKKQMFYDGKWNDYNGSILIKDVQEIKAKYENEAGSESLIAVKQVDGQAPSGTVIYDKNPDGTITATLDPSEDVTVISDKNIKDAPLKFLFTSSGSHEFIFEDKSGNRGTAKASAAVGTVTPIDPERRKER